MFLMKMNGGQVQRALEKMFTDGSGLRVLSKGPYRMHLRVEHQQGKWDVKVSIGIRAMDHEQLLGFIETSSNRTSMIVIGPETTAKKLNTREHRRDEALFNSLIVRVRRAMQRLRKLSKRTENMSNVKDNAQLPICCK